MRRIAPRLQYSIPPLSTPMTARTLRANRVILFFAYAVLSAGTIAALLPQLWMVACSFKPGGEIFSQPRSVMEWRKKDPRAYPGLLRVTADLLTHDKPTTSNYRRLFKEQPFGGSFVKSIVVAPAGEFGIYWTVVLPVIRPAVGALTIFTFMNDWNNYRWPLIVLRSNETYTLPLGLAGLVGVYSQEYGMLMAGTLLSTLPIILLFLWMQKEFVSGITLGAVKE